MHTASFNGTEQAMWSKWHTHDGTAFKWPRGGWPSQVFPSVECVFVTPTYGLILNPSAACVMSSG